MNASQDAKGDQILGSVKDSATIVEIGACVIAALKFATRKKSHVLQVVPAVLMYTSAKVSVESTEIVVVLAVDFPELLMQQEKNIR